jgi:DMSO/TMAO reductase YedYZ molybdopterin-dependent catalytic subunit
LNRGIPLETIAGMRLPRGVATAATLIILSLASSSYGDPVAPTIEVGGALPRKGEISLSELKKLSVTKTTWKTRGEEHQVTGVGLDKVLAQFGFEPGRMGKDTPKEEKRRGWRKVVLATGSDGYTSVLSCAEVFEEMGATRAVVAWEFDGTPLPADRGPLRLVVLTDKEPSRSVYGLWRLEIVDLTPAPR